MDRQKNTGCGEKAFAEFIRKCLEKQQGEEFIIKIPLRREGADHGKEV